VQAPASSQPPLAGLASLQNWQPVAPTLFSQTQTEAVCVTISVAVQLVGQPASRSADPPHR
jgi:hypothetical protein